MLSQEGKGLLAALASCSVLFYLIVQNRLIDNIVDLIRYVVGCTVVICLLALKMHALLCRLAECFESFHYYMCVCVKVLFSHGFIYGNL